MTTHTPHHQGWSLPIMIQCGCLAALVVAAVLLFTPASGGVDTVPPGPSVLVLYDDEGQYGWLGEIYSTKLENLLGMLQQIDRVVKSRPFDETLL